MSNEVYANNNEVSCKAADGKTICAMPDVCMTPPQTPATPPGVPIPYPNTGIASDCTDGSTSVEVSGQPVMLKNKSYFKKSTGDEAGSAPMKGVISSSNKGSVYFIAWSMDVMIEGENVVRNLDMTTGNHACPTANAAAPWTYVDRMAMAKGLSDCDGDRQRVKDNCSGERPECPSSKGVKDAEKDRKTIKDASTLPGKEGFKKDLAYIAANKKVTEEYEKFADTMDSEDQKCQKALKCFLVPQRPQRCCPGQTPHHLIPASAIVEEGGRGRKGGENVLKDFDGYKSGKAPCMCVEGTNADTATHMEAHSAWADYIGSLDEVKADVKYKNGPPQNVSTITYKEASDGAVKTAKTLSGDCDEDCIRAQINQSHLGKSEASDEDNEKKMRRTMDDDHYRTPEDPDGF
jgi:hypothetical protein